MSDIDKTKDNIKLHELDDFQKKELFNKFKDAGGEVLSEREKRKGLIIDREKQAEHRKRLDEHHYKESSVKRSVTTSNKRKASSSKDTSGELVSDFFSRFRIRMRLRFGGITGMNTVFFSPKFFKKFNNEYKKSLLEIQLIYFFFFKQDPKTGNRIITRLDKMNSIYYEVIEKIGELYDQMTLDQIVEQYQVFPDVPKPLSELAGPLNELFRELYILKPYENIINSAFDQTMDLYSKISESPLKKYKKKDSKNSLYIIFHKLYPRLHTLFCYYQNYLFDDVDQRIDDLLAVKPSEVPGNRISRKQEFSTGGEKAMDVEKVEETEQPDNVENE